MHQWLRTACGAQLREILVILLYNLPKDGTYSMGWTKFILNC